MYDYLYFYSSIVEQRTSNERTYTQWDEVSKSSFTEVFEEYLRMERGYPGIFS